MGLLYSDLRVVWLPVDWYAMNLEIIVALTCLVAAFFILMWRPL